MSESVSVERLSAEVRVLQVGDGSLVSDGRSRRWEWNSHEVIVGINMWELRESWEQGRDDTQLVPPEPEPVSVHRGVPVSRDERLRVYEERKAGTPPEVAAPKPEPAPQQVPVPGETSSEAAGPVSDSVDPQVERNARALADAVRGRGRTYRELFHGRVPASYEPDVAYAVSQGWVVTEGDVVRLGPVDSRLPEPVGDVSLSGSRGWSRLFG